MFLWGGSEQNICFYNSLLAWVGMYCFVVPEDFQANILGEFQWLGTSCFVILKKCLWRMGNVHRTLCCFKCILRPLVITGKDWWGSYWDRKQMIAPVLFSLVHTICQHCCVIQWIQCSRLQGREIQNIGGMSILQNLQKAHMSFSLLICKLCADRASENQIKIRTSGWANR